MVAGLTTRGQKHPTNSQKKEEPWSQTHSGGANEGGSNQEEGGREGWKNTSEQKRARRVKKEGSRRSHDRKVVGLSPAEEVLPERP